MLQTSPAGRWRCLLSEDDEEFFSERTLKLTALKLYLGQKDQQVETELEKAADALYQKTVPAGVREFIDLRAGISVPARRELKRNRRIKEQESEGVETLEPFVSEGEN